MVGIEVIAVCGAFAVAIVPAVLDWHEARTRQKIVANIIRDVIDYDFARDTIKGKEWVEEE